MNGDSGGRGPVRVVIADDHPLFRDGLAVLLRSGGDTELAGVATTGPEAVELAIRLRPDVVVLDVRMPGLTGIEATRRILADCPQVAVVVLSMLDDDESVFAALRAGARGYLLKGATREEIRAAVHAAAAGEAIFGAGIAGRMLAFFACAQPGQPSQPRRPRPVFPQLTDREREVLELVAQGSSNAAIASRLHVAPKTVRNHVSSILVKLQVASRAQAIVTARDAGLGRS
jgi:DNA-binding NarL/FixJ family response regulator